jgi:hypothetical protein
MFREKEPPSIKGEMEKLSRIEEINKELEQVNTEIEADRAKGKDGQMLIAHVWARRDRLEKEKRELENG